MNSFLPQSLARYSNLAQALRKVLRISSELGGALENPDKF